MIPTVVNSRGCHTSSENGRMENEEKEEPIGQQLLHGERCDTPITSGMWRIENREEELPLSQLVVRIYALFTRSDHFGVSNTNEMQKVVWCINLPGEKQKLCSKTFAQEVFSILCPPSFKESVPCPHSLKIDNGKKEV